MWMYLLAFVVGFLVGIVLSKNVPIALIFGVVGILVYSGIITVGINTEGLWPW